MGKVKKKKYSKTVAFLNKYNVPEHKALASLKIYAKKETSHLVRVRSWPMICYDTLNMLKSLPKKKINLIVLSFLITLTLETMLR